MWKIRHCQACTVESLRRSKSKLINYSKLTAISQEANENLSSFLERFREALVKHTNLTPGSVEGQLILKDKFIIQSAPDIRRKLQKLAIGPESTLDNLLKVATSVLYNRDQEEEIEKTGEARPTKMEVLYARLRESRRPQSEPGGKRSVPFTYHKCGQVGHMHWNCPKRHSGPPEPCPVCQGNQWKFVPGDGGLSGQGW